MLKESVDLFEGWYVKSEENEAPVVEDLRMVVHNWTEWKNVKRKVTDLVIPPNCCNEAEFSLFDVSRLKFLKSIQIGDDCFENVSEVKLIGLKELKSVVIGKNSFTKHKNSCGYDPYRHFYLKNCEGLRELKIGCFSFSDFSVCKIENVPSLEVIEMGELHEWSRNFFYASLELKSEPQKERMMSRYAELEIPFIWKESIQ